MQKLISELLRLYLPVGILAKDELEAHLSGHSTVQVSLAANDGRMRAVVIPFDQFPVGSEAHWTRLCEVANAMQSQLGFPAPAVSINGDKGFALWLSLETPVPVALLEHFVRLVHKAYFASLEFSPKPAAAPLELPPCLHQPTGRWAAFIHPGLGASFADESGLEMPPPLAGQVALLEHLDSISEATFMRALGMLEAEQGEPARPGVQATLGAVNEGGLLLKDARLEDIVRHLHLMNIEPTFRHLLKK